MVRRFILRVMNLASGLSRFSFWTLLLASGAAHAQSMNSHGGMNSSTKTDNNPGIRADAKPAASDLERNKKSDQLDGLLAYVARCPDKASFMLEAPKFLKSPFENTDADVCNKIDMGALPTYRNLAMMKQFYANLQIQTDEAGRPMAAISNTLKMLCEQSLDSNVDPRATLEMLHSYSCSEGPQGDKASTGIDYGDALFDPSNSQHSHAQGQVDSFRDSFKDSNFDPITSKGSTQGLKDPIFNLQCGVTIMENQMRTGRGIFGSSSYYWSVLNTRLGGFPKVMGRLKAVQASDRWPAACNGG